MKFKVGDKVRVREDLENGFLYGAWCCNAKMISFKGKELTVEKVYDEFYEVKENDWYWTDEMLEEVKKEVQEKTFREVIATIKLGEVWESEEKIISLMNTNDVVITLKDRDTRINSMGFASSTLYHLQRKECTFEEAFKAYEEGKEIESCEGPYRYKKQNGNDAYFDTSAKAWWNGEPITISLQEIRGKWYINN